MTHRQGTRRRLVAAVTSATLLAAGAAFAAPVSAAPTTGLSPSPLSTLGKKLLVATFDRQDSTVVRGSQFKVSGQVSKVTQEAVGQIGDGVPASFTLQVVAPSGRVLATQSVTAGALGSFSTTVPGTVTSKLDPDTDVTALAVRAVDATYADYAAADAGAAAVAVATTDTTLHVENSFVSAVGWVKPGDTYPSRVIVSNPTDSAFSDVTVTVTAPTGASFTDARSANGSVTEAPRTVTWTIPSIAAATAGGPTVSTLILEEQAATLAEEPTLVWRDLSTTAVMTVAGTPDQTVVSHGPKVIPPKDKYDSARYGDRPFPVVPVEYTDRAYQSGHSGDQLEGVINSPELAGSTFNLYQEMSIKQLFPNGTVPSAGIATADFTYEPGFDFSHFQPGQTCGGATMSDSPVPAEGTPAYPERIKNGVYQLPGDTGYYGSDANGSALVGAVAGVGALQNIDSGCGPAGKLVYDAAAIADPEIDYSDYDTDKDGVVDFFMAVFAGCGGNGSSQLSAAGCDYAGGPYDNVWPHSSSLEYYYTDPDTGLKGFVTDDQLKDLEGRTLFYTSSARSDMTTTETAFPVMVRVGPYNVNPETAIDKASVISHEYGHSLGLPDFYSTGSRDTYGDWNLMATDKSQNMDAFSRQELGWVVPQALEAGSTRTVSGWADSKQDIHKIVWQQADGTPYELTGPRVHNSEMYVAKLPGRQLLDPDTFDTGEKASKTHAWWSGSGNDFGCPPSGGRNLDLAIPGLAALPAGSTVKLAFKSRWDIEWDYDYGYVLTTTDGGETYQSHASENGYTTSNAGVPGNANQNACQGLYDNGLTGTSGSYDAGTESTDRVAGDYPDPVFLSDSYDISDLAGEANGALRLSYATDPGLARPGWFIDDVKVTATTPSGEQVLLDTDFESDGGPDDPRVYNGGCHEDLTTAQQCTKGWRYIAAGAEDPNDHAYYMEMRDRSGFDFNGNGQVDRDAIGFHPGLYLAYTDEAHGYGNVGTDNPPAQSPLDSQPEPDSDSPNLNDAAWTAKAGDNAFTDSGAGHTDNYSDPGQSEVDSRYPKVSNPWRFRYDCLTFDVLSMTGEDVGPATSDGNLTGDVKFTMGSGCGAFDYGYEDTAAPAPVNHPPVADITASSSNVRPGEEVTFSAADSTDEETPDDLDYSWDFGDGGSTKDAQGKVVTRTFSEAKTYVVTLTATDPRGATGKKQFEVNVAGEPVAPNERPRAHASAKSSGVWAGHRLALSSAGSTDHETPNGLTYAWNFDNGGRRVDSTKANPTVRYRKAGKHQITLTVTDPSGAKDTDTVTVVVRQRIACESDQVTRKGAWQDQRSRRAAGHRYCSLKRKGVLAMSFRGPRIDLSWGKADQGGFGVVLVDGHRAGRIDFGIDATSPVFRFHRIFAGFGEGTHRVRLVVKRGAAYVDHFVIRR